MRGFAALVFVTLGFATLRADELRVCEGKWGDWKDEIYGAENFYACGAQLQIESPCSEDTAANGLKLVFCGANCWDTQETKTIFQGNWGNWRDIVKCPKGYYISGGNARFEKDQGTFGDDTAFNGLIIRCRNPSNG